MSIAVSLDDTFVKQARLHANVEDRSLPMQILHWAKIGRIAEENPELSYHFIKDILLGMDDAQNGNVEEYVPGTL
jgi:hypothetical protein